MLLSSQMAFSQDKTEGKELLEAARTAQEMSGAIKSTGIIESTCTSCLKDLADKTYLLDKDKIVLDTPYYMKPKAPYVIHLKRTKDSPTKINLKFKNGHRVCGKMTAYTIPVTGNFEVACLIYITQYEEEEFDINLKDLPPLKDGVIETLEIKLSKDNIDKSKYNVDLNYLSNQTIIIDKDEKFWGSGYNFKLTGLKN